MRQSQISPNKVHQSAPILIVYLSFFQMRRRRLPIKIALHVFVCAIKAQSKCKRNAINQIRNFLMWMSICFSLGNFSAATAHQWLCFVAYFHCSVFLLASEDSSQTSPGSAVGQQLLRMGRQTSPGSAAGRQLLRMGRQTSPGSAAGRSLLLMRRQSSRQTCIHQLHLYMYMYMHTPAAMDESSSKEFIQCDVSRQTNWML